MLIVSLHKIKINAPVGLYNQEQILGNIIEVDVDVFLPSQQPWIYADYGLIRNTTEEVFAVSGTFLETFAFELHSKLKLVFPLSQKIKVIIRKMNPPIQGENGYAQITFEE